MSVQLLSRGVWALEEDGVRSFLVVGSARAILLDTGWGTLDLPAEIAKITSLPVTLVNTHGDIDHIGLNSAFKADAWAHPDELPMLKEKTPDMEYRPCPDGYVFDLGGRTLTVIHIPGHTAGSIALLDDLDGILFSGDTAGEASIFMFGAGRDYKAFAASQKKLAALGDRVKTVYPCHGPCPVAPEGLFESLAELMERIISGEKVTETEHMCFPDDEFDVFTHRLGRVSIYTF